MNDLHLLLPFPSRINPGASAAWLEVFTGDIHDLAKAFALEADMRKAVRPVPAAQYIERRRITSCAWLLADLAELAASTRPCERDDAYRALVECGADIA